MTLLLTAEPLAACADAAHAQCRVVQRLLTSERGPFILPGPVPEDVDARLSAHAGPRARRGFFEDLVARRFHVERLTPRDVPQIEQIERDYAELELDLTALAVVVVAARVRCTRIVTFDEAPYRAIRPLYGDEFTLLPGDA